MASANLPRFARLSSAMPEPSTILLGVLAFFATESLLQGIVDVTLPFARHEEPFRFLFAQTQLWGPGFFFLYVFVHNLGLACMVPAYGVLGGWFERRRMNRLAIGALLFAAVLASLAMSLAWMLHDAERFDMGFAIPLYVAESAAVIVPAALGAREVARWEPAEGLQRIMRETGWPFVVSAALLLLLAAVETVFVLGGR